MTGKSFETFIRSSLYNKGYRLLNLSLTDEYYDYCAGREFKFDILVEGQKDFLVLIEAKDHEMFDSALDLFYFIAESDIWLAYKRIKENNEHLAISRFLAVSGDITERVLKAGLTYGIGFIFPGCNPSAYDKLYAFFVNTSHSYLFYGTAKPLANDLIKRILTKILPRNYK